MVTKEDILILARIKRKLRSRDIVLAYKVSRQYANVLIRALLVERLLLKIGSTNKAFYVLPDYAKRHSEVFPPKLAKHLKNRNLKEHEVYDEIESQYPPIRQLPENVRSIFNYAFSEMLNNAIEHSKSEKIDVEISVQNRKLNFIVNDFGVGVYRNVMKKKKLKKEIFAIQDLLKGKLTTSPRSHSGQGIFFTSKAADIFTLESFGYLLVVNSKINDIFIHRPPALKHGTRVKFSIDVNSPRHLKDVITKFETGEPDSAFDKTEIKVKLYDVGGVSVSRSQARRILVGLNKFKSITLDFDKVPMIGQAFVDEIFRVFQNRHSHIKIIPINMEEGVKFMIDRVGK